MRIYEEGLSGYTYLQAKKVPLTAVASDLTTTEKAVPVSSSVNP
jgi:hypothetical protein